MDPRAAASHSQSTIAMYTELDAVRDQQATIVGDCRCHMATSPGVISTRPTAVACLYAWPFLHSRVWHKAPEEVGLLLFPSEAP